jgi:hypothetical protein
MIHPHNPCTQWILSRVYRNSLSIMNSYICYTHSQGTVPNCGREWLNKAYWVQELTIWAYADKPTTRCTINKQCWHYVYVFVGAYDSPSLMDQTTPSQCWMYCITRNQRCCGGSGLVHETKYPLWAFCLTRAATYTTRMYVQCRSTEIICLWNRCSYLFPTTQLPYCNTVCSVQQLHFLLVGLF